jgi:uncharacterized metal-binding protein
MAVILLRLIDHYHKVLVLQAVLCSGAQLTSICSQFGHVVKEKNQLKDTRRGPESPKSMHNPIFYFHLLYTLGK